MLRTGFDRLSIEYRLVSDLPFFIHHEKVPSYIVRQSFVNLSRHKIPQYMAQVHIRIVQYVSCVVVLLILDLHSSIPGSTLTTMPPMCRTSRVFETSRFSLTLATLFSRLSSYWLSSLQPASHCYPRLTRSAKRWH